VSASRLPLARRFFVFPLMRRLGGVAIVYRAPFGPAILIALMRSWPRRALAMIGFRSNNAGRGGRIAGREAILHGLVVLVLLRPRRHQFLLPPDS
jgi:hypothetical protein